MENGKRSDEGKRKITAYLGFAVRSGKITFGVDGAESLKKGVYLLLADGELKENSFRRISKLRERFDCPLIVTGEGELGEMLHRAAVKAVAVKEKNLAAAILAATKETETQYKIYSGGNI